MVDLLKDWNPNRYMVDVEDDTTPPEQNNEEITEVITEKDEDFEAIIKVKDLWAKYMISAFDKITSDCSVMCLSTPCQLPKRCIFTDFVELVSMSRLSTSFIKSIACLFR